MFVTGAVGNGESMKKAILKKPSLKVINDRVLIEEDEMDFETENKNVTDALKSGLLALPEEFEGWAKKVPDKGRIVSYGDKCKYAWQPGDHVMYGRFSGQRLTFGGKKYVIVVEHDIHMQFE